MPHPLQHLPAFILLLICTNCCQISMTTRKRDPIIPLNVPNVNIENRKKKIHFDQKSVLSYFILDFFFPIVSYAYFIIISLPKCYNEEDPTKFWVSFVFGVLVPYIISCMSLYACWRDNRKKLTNWGPLGCTQWWLTFSRWVFHFPLPIPSIPRFKKKLYIFYNIL